MSSENLPDISAIMSVHDDNPQYVEQAIRSILGQTHTNFEFIIVNDGSTKPETIACLMDSAAQDSRIIIINNVENIGLTKSLNIAIEHSRGKLIARQDADDASLPGRFEMQWAAFKKNPSLGLLGGKVIEIDADSKVLRTRDIPSGHAIIFFQLHYKNTFFHTTVMFRRSILTEHRLRYNEEYRYAQDYALWSEMAKYCEVDNLDHPLAYYRIHPKSISANKADEQMKVVKKVSIERLKESLPEEQVEDLAVFQNWVTDNHSRRAAANIVSMIRMTEKLMLKVARRTPAHPKDKSKPGLIGIKHWIYASIPFSRFIMLALTQPCPLHLKLVASQFAYRLKRRII